MNCRLGVHRSASHCGRVTPGRAVHREPTPTALDWLHVAHTSCLSPQPQDDLCDALVEVARPDIQRSRVSSGTETPSRTSWGTFLTGKKESDPAVLRLEGYIRELLSNPVLQKARWASRASRTPAAVVRAAPTPSAATTTQAAGGAPAAY